MFKLKECLLKAAQKGQKISQKELGQLLWPNSTEQTARVNISALANGRTNSIKIEFVNIICEKLECTPNELFGVE